MVGIFGRSEVSKRIEAKCARLVSYPDRGKNASRVNFGWVCAPCAPRSKNPVEVKRASRAGCLCQDGNTGTKNTEHEAALHKDGGTGSSRRHGSDGWLRGG